MDAVIVSDIHLGSELSQAKLFVKFLEDLECENLILNGDIVDNWDFRRLKKNHWKVLSKLRKLSNKINIIWIAGNHDGPAEMISNLLGIEFVDEYILESGDKRILILHGHTFDKFINNFPFITWLGDCFYYILQKIDKTFKIARQAKKTTKQFLRCDEKIEKGALERAKSLKCDIVCCGHTHCCVSKEKYYNGGCWTEIPVTYLTIDQGIVKLNKLN